MKKRVNPKVEAMKERSLIVENERQNLHTPKFYLTEQEVTDHDRSYDYKKDGDKYFFRKKGESEWKQTNNAAVKGVFGDQPSTPTQTEKPSVDVPFKNAEEGNKFRGWVNDTHPDYAKQIQLDREGSHNNSYISKAWQKYGEEYSKSRIGKTKDNSVELSPLASSNFIIDTSEISATDTSKLSCKAGTKDCAQFVNNYSDKVDNVGNAWTAHDTSSVGTHVWSAYKGLDSDTINKISEIYSDIKKQNGAIDGIKDSPIIKKIKKLQMSIISKKGKPDDLKIDDIVGIYYPESEHHERAFEEAADFGKGYFVDGKPGNTLSGGDSFGFNTHVGIVGAIKDGKPVIFHNTGQGNIISEPADKLNIVWVKRIGATKPVKDEETNSWFSDMISYFK